jgi:hypothetical protein
MRKRLTWFSYGLKHVEMADQDLDVDSEEWIDVEWDAKPVVHSVDK